MPVDQLLMSDLSLHSIGIVLDRLGKHAVLPQFVEDVFAPNGVTLISVQPQAIRRLVTAIDQFGLDFDDAYQYVAAEERHAILISFDSDFDKTDRGRQTPEYALSLSQTDTS
jgi:predicted nucleic acid-binding protein